MTRRGPPRKVSFDAAGAPTRAALAFAGSCGVPVEALGTERDANGNEYLHYSGRQERRLGPRAAAGLVQSALDALPIPRRMRWGALEAQFVRPVHWLVMLHGSELIVPRRCLASPPAATSFGHRFMAPGRAPNPLPGELCARAAAARPRAGRYSPSGLKSCARRSSRSPARLQGRAILSDALAR